MDDRGPLQIKFLALTRLRFSDYHDLGVFTYMYFRPRNPMRYVTLRTLYFVDVILVFPAQKLKIQNG